MTCQVTWTYPANDWVDGFSIYQGGDLVANVGPLVRNASCSDLNLIPGGGDVTITARAGNSESPHSAPAEFVLAAPTISITP